jgi:hypothetical protein
MVSTRRLEARIDFELLSGRDIGIGDVINGGTGLQLNRNRGCWEVRDMEYGWK